MPVVGVAVTGAVEGGSGGGALGRMMGVSAAFVLSNLLKKLSLTEEGGLVMEDGATTTLV